MAGMDWFWDAIDGQLDKAKTAKSADDVVKIFASDTSSGAFFGGSGGDDRLDDALWEAGWRYAWREASYNWAMIAPDGSGITYVEGDIYPEIERPLPHGAPSGD